MSNRTVFEYQVDINDLMSKMATVDKKVDETTSKFISGAKNMGSGYTEAGKQAVAGTTLMAKGSNQAMTAVTGLNWMISDSPYLFQNMRMGIMAVSNNVTPLAQNISYLVKETGSMKNAFKAMSSVFTGPMGIVFAITAVVAIIQTLSIVMAKHKEKTEGATDANNDFAKSLDNILKSTDIDYLKKQIVNAEELKKITIDRTSELQKEKRTYVELGEAINKTKADAKKAFVLFPGKSLYAIEKAKNDAQALVDEFKKTHPEIELTEENINGIITSLSSEINENNIIIGQQNSQIRLSKEQIEYAEGIGEKSRDLMRYEEKLEEFRISKLETDEQIIEWQTKKAEIDAKILGIESGKVKSNESLVDLKEKQLDLDKKIYNSQKQQEDKKKENEEKGLNAAQKAADASKAAYEKIKEEYDLFLQGIDTSSDQYLQSQISRLEQEMAITADGTKEKLNMQEQYYAYLGQLTTNQEERAKALMEYELEYQRKIADALSDGDLESIYEQTFGNIKQRLFQFALDRLGVTQAMMNMEQLIVTAGEKGIDGIRDFFHKKEQVRQAEETSGAAMEAGSKGVASASGIPFPGNIAAIGLVLASVFSALRKAKINGTQIVAAAEGAIINKPTLLLAGEALSRSGTEIVMPEKNFNRYMEKQIIPGIMAKVNIDNSGLRDEIKQLKGAIYDIGRQIPGETGKAVTRSLRGKF